MSREGNLLFEVVNTERVRVSSLAVEAFLCILGMTVSMASTETGRGRLAYPGHSNFSRCSSEQQRVVFRFRGFLCRFAMILAHLSRQVSVKVGGGTSRGERERLENKFF
jgi:hypothetical protein